MIFPLEQRAGFGFALFCFTVQYNKDNLLIWDKVQAYLSPIIKDLYSLSLEFLSCVASSLSTQHPPGLLGITEQTWLTRGANNECKTQAT